MSAFPLGINEINPRVADLAEGWTNRHAKLHEILACGSRRMRGLRGMGLIHAAKTPSTNQPPSVNLLNSLEVFIRSSELGRRDASI